MSQHHAYLLKGGNFFSTQRHAYLLKDCIFLVTCAFFYMPRPFFFVAFAQSLMQVDKMLEEPLTKWFVARPFEA